MDTPTMQYCFLLATQTNKSLPYVILKLGTDADTICAVSRDELISMCLDGSIKLCNATIAEVKSGLFKAPLEEYSELQLDEYNMQLEHPYILWDILEKLILEDAKFKLSGNDRIFSFSDLSFSMKTDEVSISFYNNDVKETKALWSTPKIDAPSSCGAIMISCSEQLKEKIIGQSKTAAATANATAYFSTGTMENFFMLNLSHLTCMWDTRYCLKRFHVAELSGLLSLYEEYKAMAAGYDLAVAFQSEASAPSDLFSHVNGKSKTSSSSIAFVIALCLPDILSIANALCSNRDTVTKICHSGSLHQLKSFILTQISGTMDNRYLDILCQTFIQIMQGKSLMSIQNIQTIVTDLACRIFQYKMAYMNPIISVPANVPFTEGRLLIYKGGTTC